MKTFEIVDQWCFYDDKGGGSRERQIGIFTAETVEEAVKQASTIDSQINPTNSVHWSKKLNKWWMVGIQCPHWIIITQLN